MSDKEFTLEPYPPDGFKLEPTPAVTPENEYDDATLELLRRAELDEINPYFVAPRDPNEVLPKNPWAKPVSKKEK